MNDEPTDHTPEGDAPHVPAGDQLEIETLAGDLRDEMLKRIRTMNRPWSLLTEDEQRDLASSLELFANEIVRGAVRLIADYEWPRAVVHIGEVKIRGEKGIEVKIGAANIEHNRNVLGDHVGDEAMLLMIDSEAFMGSRGPVRIDPDQPELPTGDAA